MAGKDCNDLLVILPEGVDKGQGLFRCLRMVQPEIIAAVQQDCFVFIRHNGNMENDDHRLTQCKNFPELSGLVGAYLPLRVVYPNDDKIPQIQRLDRGFDAGVEVALRDVRGQIVIAADCDPGLIHFAQTFVQDLQIGVADLVTDITGHDDGIAGVGQLQQAVQMLFRQLHLLRGIGFVILDGKTGPPLEPRFVSQRLHLCIRIVGMIQMDVTDVVNDLFGNAFDRESVMIENSAGRNAHIVTSLHIRGKCRRCRWK